MIRKQRSPLAGHIRVTFELPSCVWADQIFVTGEFNRWDEHALPMKQARDGVWRANVDLQEGSDYQFRYVIDGQWQTDHHADGFSGNQHGSQNSLIHACLPPCSPLDSPLDSSPETFSNAQAFDSTSISGTVSGRIHFEHRQRSTSVTPRSAKGTVDLQHHRTRTPQRASGRSLATMG